MIRVAIPLFQPDDPLPLQGLTVGLGPTSGIGDLPSDLHLASLSRQTDVFPHEDPPAAVWFDIDSLTDDEIRVKSIPLLGVIHLLGSGVAAISEAWIYKESSVGVALDAHRQTRLQLFGRGDAFFLPAGTTEESITLAYDRMIAAVSVAPWLRITIEHFLLALDRAGLSEGKLDMTICLESLIHATTEIGFRFSHQLCRLVTDSPSEIADYQAVLAMLYEVRSKHVHGGRPKVAHWQELTKRRDELEDIMRQAVNYAVAFHAREGIQPGDWERHLNSRLHGTTARIERDWGVEL